MHLEPNRIRGIRESVANWLLDHGCDIVNEKLSQYKNKALWTACEKEAFDMIELLIQDGVNINERDEYGDTVLIKACRDERFDEAKVRRVVEGLVNVGANVDISGSKRLRAFTVVCELGYKTVAEFLIQRGVDINFKDQYNRTALSRACKVKQRDIVELLLENSANIDTENGNANALFIYSCGEGMTERVVMLLDRGINSNLQQGEAFYSACENGRAEIVKILLSRGFCLDLGHQTTGVKIALWNGKDNIISALLDSGVALDLNNIFRVASFSGRVSTLELLLNRGADVNSRYESTNDLVDLLPTGLMNACVGWRAGTVKWLIEKGVDVNLVSPKTGMNALMYACTCLDGEIARMLIRAGTDLSLKDKSGLTALAHACWQGSYETVKLLLDQGVDLNTQDLAGRTALMYACIYHFRRDSSLEYYLPRFGNNSDFYLTYSRRQNCAKVEIIKLLLHRGADINIVDDCGAPAVYHIMGNHFNYPSMQLLIDSGADLQYFDKNGVSILSWIMQHNRLRNFISILMKTGIFTENGRLKPKYKSALRYPWCVDINCLKEIMTLGYFEWDVSEQNGDEYRDFPGLIRLAMDCGLSPSNFLGPGGEILSPLIYAYKQKYLDLLEAIIDHGYFYPEDYKRLCYLFDKEDVYVQFESDFKLMVMNTIHNPLSLFKWSFINVSKAISMSGPPSEKKERINALKIPELLKHILRGIDTKK